MMTVAPTEAKVEEEAEFEVWQDDQMVAGTMGRRADALREALHYLAVYRIDGPAKLVEVRRVEVDAAAIRDGKAVAEPLSDEPFSEEEQNRHCRKTLDEMNESLQAIGQEFGFYPGERRVHAVRRVLTEQRDRIRTLEAGEQAVGTARAKAFAEAAAAVRRYDWKPHVCLETGGVSPREVCDGIADMLADRVAVPSPDPGTQAGSPRNVD